MVTDCMCTRPPEVVAAKAEAVAKTMVRADVKDTAMVVDMFKAVVGAKDRVTAHLRQLWHFTLRK